MRASAALSAGVLALCGLGLLVAVVDVLGDLWSPPEQRDYPFADPLVASLLLGLHLAGMLVYAAQWHRGRALAGWTAYVCTGLPLGAYLHEQALSAQLGYRP